MKLKASPSPTPVCDIIDYYKHLGKDVKELKNEDVLNLELMPLEPSVAEPEIDLSDSHLKVALGILEQEIVRIDRLAFVELFTRASKMRLGTSAYYITGLKIHFGLAGKKIVPIFQPVFMERKSISSDIYTYETSFELCYIYNKGKKEFEEAKRPDFDLIHDYRSSIQIKHETIGNYGSFSSDDIQGVIFPFQTIFSLLYYNTGDSEVFLYNSIRNESNKMKHCILLATKVKPFSVQVFENKYANRSHLCPPCHTVKYSVSGSGPTTCP